MDQTQEDRLWARAVQGQHNLERDPLLQPALMPSSESLSSPNDIHPSYRDEIVRTSGDLAPNSHYSDHISHQWHDAGSANIQPGQHDIDSHFEPPRCIDPKMLEIRRPFDRDSIGHAHTLLYNTSVNSTAPHRHYGDYGGGANGVLRASPFHSQHGTHRTPTPGLQDTHALPVVDSLHYEDRFPPWFIPASCMTASIDPYLSHLDPVSHNQTPSEQDTRSYLPGDMQQIYQPMHTSQISCIYTPPTSHNAMRVPSPGSLHVGQSDNRSNPTVGSSCQAGKLLGTPQHRLVAGHS